jgi:Glycosyltransferase family 87
MLVSLTRRRAGAVSVVVFVAATLVGVAYAGAIATSRPALLTNWSILWRLAGWAAAWVVATVAALRLPRRGAVALIVVASVLVRLAALAGPPTTSDDLYRYGWDGRVQAAGVDPYRYPPAAPQLAHLREGWLFPGVAGCAALHRPTPCTRINRPEDRTIYPPVAEAWFAAVYRLSGIGARHKAWQVAGLLVDLVTVGLLVVALRRWGGDERWVALYALCPAVVLELVNNAHVDGLAIALVVGALIVARPPPGVRSFVWRDVVTGLLIGAAALVKVYPATLLLPLVGLPRPHPWRSLARAAAAAAALGGLAYLPHVLAVGSKVVGYLPGYLKEEHYNKGGRFLLAGALGLHGNLATAAAVSAVAAAAAWVAWRKPPLPRGAVVLLGTILLATTPVQPWYAVALVALAAVAARPHWAAVTAAGYPYYFAVIVASRHQVGIGRASYGTALVAVIAGWMVGRWRRRRASVR